jgi:hypothetical protein
MFNTRGHGHRHVRRQPPRAFNGGTIRPEYNTIGREKTQHKQHMGTIITTGTSGIPAKTWEGRTDTAPALYTPSAKGIALKFLHSWVWVHFIWVGWFRMEMAIPLFPLIIFLLFLSPLFSFTIFHETGFLFSSFQPPR